LLLSFIEDGNPAKMPFIGPLYVQRQRAAGNLMFPALIFLQQLLPLERKYILVGQKTSTCGFWPLSPKSRIERLFG
jgi:hypothetical protein